MADPKLTAAAITLFGNMNTMAIFCVVQSIEKSNADLRGTMQDVPQTVKSLQPFRTFRTFNQATLDAIREVSRARNTSEAEFEALKQRNQRELAALEGK
jgi:hypothetical protein